MAFVCFSPAPFPVSYQLFRLVDGLLGNRPNGALCAVSLGFLPLPALDGIPELAVQFFRPSEKSAPKELLRRGLDLFFCVF